MIQSLSRNVAHVDQRQLLARRPSAWARGDYAAAGNALQRVAEELCESVNLCQDEAVLDVAAGSFHAALGAARRWCDVTAIEQVSDLTRRGPQRVEAASAGVRVVDADAEALPFADQGFDVVLSAFGAMFAPDQERAASEMVRVCRRGGRVGLSSWTPQGFIGQLFVTVERHAPEASSGLAPFAWGTVPRLEQLFGAYGTLAVTRRNVVLRAATPAEWVDRLSADHLPLSRAFTQLDTLRRKTLRGELLELVTRFNGTRGGTMQVNAEYLEAVITRR